MMAGTAAQSWYHKAEVGLSWEIGSDAGPGTSFQRSKLSKLAVPSCIAAR